MDYDKLRQLLGKYWKGETDLSEETFLIEFFTQNEQFPDDLQAEKQLFHHFRREAQKGVVAEDLTQKLKRRWATEKQPIRIKLSYLTSVMRYAAVLVVVLSVGYFLANKGKPSPAVPLDTFDDPNKAIAETEKVLSLLSTNMNTGLAKIQTLQLFDEVSTVKSPSRKFPQSAR